MLNRSVMWIFVGLAACVGLEKPKLVAECATSGTCTDTPRDAATVKNGDAKGDSSVGGAPDATGGGGTAGAFSASGGAGAGGVVAGGAGGNVGSGGIVADARSDVPSAHGGAGGAGASGAGGSSAGDAGDVALSTDAASDILADGTRVDDAADVPAGVIDSSTANACTSNCTPLPVIVDGIEHFVPSGYQGDWPGIKEVSSDIDAAACTPARSSATAVGKCHHWTWNYSNGTCPTAGNPGAVCGQWACVAWLKPYNLFMDPANPGPAAGLPIAAGATNVQFYAWAPKPTNIRFSVGTGSEGVSGSVVASLTTTPAKFQIDVSMSTYNIVNNGFQWCTNDSGATGTEFYVDDIQWR